MRPDPGWYRDGLRFECVGCSDCCRTHGDYAYVYLNGTDVDRIAAHLGTSRVDLLNAHCRTDGDGSIHLSMTEGDCNFLCADGRCLVYPVRPRQCEAWPFWTENLAREVWYGEVAPACPGVGRRRLYTAEEIERIARERDEWYGVE